MTAQPADPDQHEVIHLGGQAAVVVPVEEYQRLRALERHASAEEPDAAEAEAAAESFEAWRYPGLYDRPDPDDAAKN